jgi:hypothetical protein
MERQRNPNIEILTSVVSKLGPVADELVFLGGCATGLLFTDPAVPPIRVTTDIDVIAEVSPYFNLSYPSETPNRWRRSPCSDAKCDGAES